jgi:2-oxoisovalerate dehydrogenase E1 component beta subunit
MAIRGYRPVCEIQFDGFVYPAFDQIVSQMAKMYFRSSGHVKMPMVIRIPFGGGIGAVEHHSESPESYFVHTPGLKVVACGNPVDAYWMIQQAIASDDPVIFLEPKRRYHERAEVDESATPPPLHSSQVVREGRNATLLSYGSTVRTCLAAAEAAAEDGLDLEVIDLRSLSPMDHDTVAASVRRTGHLVVAHEAPRHAGLGAEVAATMTDRCFEYLEAAPERVTGHGMPYPPARLEGHYLPDLDRILDGVDRVLGRVPGGVAAVGAFAGRATEPALAGEEVSR